MSKFALDPETGYLSTEDRNWLRSKTGDEVVVTLKARIAGYGNRGVNFEFKDAVDNDVFAVVHARDILDVAD